MKKAWATCDTMTLFAIKHACIALKMFLWARNSKILIDEVLMLHWQPSLLIQLLHVITFKLYRNEICDLEGT